MPPAHSDGPVGAGQNNSRLVVVNTVEEAMTSNRIMSIRRTPMFAVVFLFLVATVMPGCVSVQKSGKPETPPLPSAGVSFNSTPPNAEVYVNGKFRGTAPVTLQLPAGTHAVDFRLAGFTTWSRDLAVVAGDDTRVTATLQPE